MDQVIIFDKSLQERLQEYSDVLRENEGLSVNQIKKEWTFYLEFSLDPNGWQAVWKIPRLTCEVLKIPFPAIVLVYIEDINFHDLKAIAKIIAVQDDISLPEKHFIPLLQLWPTKEQDKSVVLNMKSTANSLDMYRFFYTYIFMPWDYEEEDHLHWINRHLESRLRLFYDMKNGVIPRATAEHIRALLTDARRLQAKREQIEVDLQDSDIDEDSSEDARIQMLMDLNVKIIQIRSEIELLENPLMRNIILRRQKELSPKKEVLKPQFILIFDEGKIDEYIGFFNQVNKFHPSEIVKCVPALASALENLNKNDTIILNKSTHVIHSTGGLEFGGCLKGIYDKENTTVTSTNENIMLDLSGNVTLENMTINAYNSQCGILVRKGKTVLKNCTIIGDEKSSTHQGIIVLRGSELELINCDISGFCTAIVGNSGSTINVRDTVIYDVNFGVRVYDFCIFKAQNCTFHDCKEYGLCVETDNSVTSGQKVGNFEVLQIIPDVSVKDSNGKNNTKGDVLINQKPKIHAIADLFSNNNGTGDLLRSKECASSASDDDMEVNETNTTVIEKDIDADINERISPLTI